MQRIFIALGLLIASIGVLYPYLKQLSLGRLPGDIVLRGENSSFYFPVISEDRLCIMILFVISSTFIKLGYVL